MPRTRSLKPGFFKNELLSQHSPLCRLLFAGLWCLADREGRLEDRPARIKAEVLAYDKVNVDVYLQQLAKSGFIIRYTVGEDRYIQITNFSRHQNPHVREPMSTLPAPIVKKTSSPVLAPGQHGSEHVQAPDTSIRAQWGPETTVLEPGQPGADTGPAPGEHSSGPAVNLIPLTYTPLPPDGDGCLDDEIARNADEMFGAPDGPRAPAQEQDSVAEYRSHFKRFWERWTQLTDGHPGDKDDAGRLWNLHVPPARVSEFFAHVENYAASDDLKRVHAMSAPKFLRQWEQWGKPRVGKAGESRKMHPFGAEYDEHGNAMRVVV